MRRSRSIADKERIHSRSANRMSPCMAVDIGFFALLWRQFLECGRRGNGRLRIFGSEIAADAEEESKPRNTRNTRNDNDLRLNRKQGAQIRQAAEGVLQSNPSAAFRVFRVFRGFFLFGRLWDRFLAGGRPDRGFTVARCRRITTHYWTKRSTI